MRNLYWDTLAITSYISMCFMEGLYFSLVLQRLSEMNASWFSTLIINLFIRSNEMLIYINQTVKKTHICDA